MELWKDYINNYEVSSYGYIRNKKTLHILKSYDRGKGYMSVRLENKMLYVHRIVAEVFLPNINNLPQINHKDGNKSNNHIDNLEWCDNSYNQQHAYNNNLKSGDLIRGHNNGRAKLKQQDILYIRDNCIPFNKEYSIQAMAKKFNVSHVCISDIINNKSW